MGTEIKRCLIVSGAPEADIAYIKPLLPGAFVVAADSGYQKCRRLGAEPDIVVGDFDSSPVPEHTKELIVMPAYKDDTDTLAAIKIAMERGYTHLILVGAIAWTAVCRRRLLPLMKSYLSLTALFPLAGRATVISPCLPLAVCAGV